MSDITHLVGFVSGMEMTISENKISFLPAVVMVIELYILLCICVCCKFLSYQKQFRILVNL